MKTNAFDKCMRLEIHIICPKSYNFADDLTGQIATWGLLQIGKVHKTIRAVTVLFSPSCEPRRKQEARRCRDKRKRIEYVYLPSDCEICESLENPTRRIWKSPHKSSWWCKLEFKVNKKTIRLPTLKRRALIKSTHSNSHAHHQFTFPSSWIIFWCFYTFVANEKASNGGMCLRCMCEVGCGWPAVEGNRVTTLAVPEAQNWLMFSVN